MTALTLETPEAKAALARCVRLLLMWADEAEENETAVSDQVEGPGALTAASVADRDDRRQDHSTQMRPLDKPEEKRDE